MKEKAILVVSFGSSYAKTREKTIHQIETEIAETYKEQTVYTAFTSRRIIEKIAATEKRHVKSVGEALEKIASEGIREVYIQPTFIIEGVQHKEMIKQAASYRERFDKMVIGDPLLTSIKDYKDAIAAFTKRHHIPQDEAVICMGHGSDEHMSVSFAALDYMFKDEGYENYYVAAIRSYPAITQVVKQLKKKAYHKVHLYPFMVVAGHHAKQDMLDKAEEAWKSLLENEGYEVESQLIGLGEYEDIRRIYIEHVGRMLREGQSEI